MFYADLHIHSKYSRATSKDCDLENLALWGAKKGLSIISTGDFTHPVWFLEIQNKLQYSGDGTFKLKDEIEKEIFKNYSNLKVPRFILSCEISTIYKKGEKTRKVHHVVFSPDIESTGKLRNKLSKIGNINSDGRPILGLDSRNLLEIVLDSNENSYIIPAHIWTPWFSVLGSKSGFNSIEECYGDLSNHIFALETGLSSDPYMNWRVSSLDKYTLVSNSDAHSPSKLAREATIFNCEENYFAMKNALQTLNGYIGTIEFFPEEGKYHLDGHRKCGICLESSETKKLNGICPICKKPLTIGVSYRVEELADRKYGEFIPPKAGKVYSLIPLVEIIAETFSLGASSKKVSLEYERLIQNLGSELDILQNTELEKIKKLSPILSIAIERLREQKVIKSAGYDGEYGTIKLFLPHEVKDFYNLKLNLEIKNNIKKEAKKEYKPAIKEIKEEAAPEKEDLSQKNAIESNSKALLIAAGPGSGKTTVLVKRIAYLIQNKIAKAKNCLAITFTKKAAGELKQRLDNLNKNEDFINIHTFHSLCFQILKENAEKINLMPDFRVICEEEKSLLDEENKNCLTFDDLINFTLKLLEKSKETAKYYRELFKFIFIDEYQDIDEKQYKLIKILAPQEANIFVIGDVNQSIYGFRGGSAKFFNNFILDYKNADKIFLENNYRSQDIIVKASNELMKSNSISKYKGSKESKIIIHKARSERAEAEFIVSKIENLIGGNSFFSMDSNRAHGWENEQNYGFSDFAILYRTKSQLKTLKEALNQTSVPYASYSEESFFADKKIRNLLESLNDNSPLFEQIKALKHKYITLIDENILNFLIELSKKHSNVYDFYHETAFLNIADTYDKRADRISLMTLHASKGLEFKCVFIAGVENNLLPLYLAKNKDEIEEEKRLLYVGMTRAKDNLFLSFCDKRMTKRGLEDRQISPFISDINKEYLIFEDFNKKYYPAPKQLKLF